MTLSGPAHDSSVAAAGLRGSRGKIVRICSEPGVSRPKVGEENRIFGTVTSQQVAVKLALQGYNIDRRNIEMVEDVRMVGVYTANVKLHTDVVAQLKVRVVPEGGEAASTSTEDEA